jgi:diguanylate cyclase (GGDEF)-like protein
MAQTEIARNGAKSAGSILVVDDSPTIAGLLRLLLKRAGYDVRVAGTGLEALSAVEERCPDLILADVMMPEMDGLELTRRIRQDSRTANVSVILVTARGMSADRLDGLAAGADDYVVKPFDPPEVLARVRGVLRRARELKAASPLTQLPGNTRIQEEIDARIRAKADFALLYADLDNFKAYNDHYGFARGDDVLMLTARLIQDVAIEEVDPDAFVGHIGGDDFVVLTTTELAPRVAEGIISAFDREAPSLYDLEDAARGYIEKEDRSGRMQRFPLVSISIGVATTERRHFSHYAEAVAIASEMKSYTKKSYGSSWATDQRTD